MSYDRLHIIEAKRKNVVEIVSSRGGGLEQVVLPAICLMPAEQVYNEHGLIKLIRLEIMINMFLLGHECGELSKN